MPKHDATIQFIEFPCVERFEAHASESESLRIGSELNRTVAKQTFAREIRIGLALTRVLSNSRRFRSGGVARSASLRIEAGRSLASWHRPSAAAESSQRAESRVVSLKVESASR